MSETEKQMKVCKWSILLGCSPHLKKEPTNSMCAACILVYLTTKIENEDLGGAGIHVQVLSEILLNCDIISEKDFREVFEAKVRDRQKDYRA